MRSSLRILVFTLFFMLPTLNCYAVGMLKGSIGLASYATHIEYDAWAAEDDDFSGFALFGTGALNHNVAIRGGFYSLEHDDYNDVDGSGIELQLLGGNNFDSVGFKIYGGVGLFNEEIEDYDFSGMLLTFGIGYNWQKIALDFWISVRDADDYEDFIADYLGYGSDATASSGALMLGYRF